VWSDSRRRQFVQKRVAIVQPNRHRLILAINDDDDNDDDYEDDDDDDDDDNDEDESIAGARPRREREVWGIGTFRLQRCRPRLVPHYLGPCLCLTPNGRFMTFSSVTCSCLHLLSSLARCVRKGNVQAGRHDVPLFARSSTSLSR